MAEFSRVMITSQGHALIAKLLTGTDRIEFTKICASEAAYILGELESLTELSDIKQTSAVSKVLRVNEVTVQVESAFNNTELTEGYFMRTLGLYATDPDVGEILYAVTIEMSGSCYMPPYNGIAVSGVYIQLVTAVGNAENVTLEVNAAAIATVGDIKILQESIDALWVHDQYHHDLDKIEAAFLERYTKVDISGEVIEEGSMTLEEIQAAVSTEWNGESSDDLTAMTVDEVDTAVNTPWNGESSEDPSALSAEDVAEATK